MQPIPQQQSYYVAAKENIQAAREAMNGLPNPSPIYIYDGQELNQDDYFAKIKRDFQTFAKERLLTSSNSSILAWKGEAKTANLLINKINTFDDWLQQEKRQPFFNETIDALICYRHMRIVDEFSRAFFVRGVSPNNSMKLIIDSEYVSYDENKNRLTDDGNAYYRPWLDTAYIGKPDASTTLWKHNLDLLAHEFGHAFEGKARLNYRNDSGALKESFADIMALMCHHYNERTPFQTAEWAVAKGCYNANFNYAMRTFTLEKTCPWDRGIKHMRDHGSFAKDYDLGAVHDKSGIPSHAFYLVCRAIGGYSYTIPGHIWCNSLLDVTPDEEFNSFARRTILTAAHTHDATIAGIVKQAWLNVGIPESELNKPMAEPDWVKKLGRTVPSSKSHEVAPVAFNTPDQLVAFFNTINLNVPDANELY